MGRVVAFQLASALLGQAPRETVCLLRGGLCTLMFCLLPLGCPGIQ